MNTEELQNAVWLPDAKRVGLTRTGRSMSLGAARTYFAPVGREFAAWMRDINKPTMPAVEFEGDVRAVEAAKAIGDEIKEFRKHWPPAFVPLTLFSHLTGCKAALDVYRTACVYAGCRLEEVTESGQWSIVFDSKLTRKELIYGVQRWQFDAAVAPAFFRYKYEVFGEP